MFTQNARRTEIFTQFLRQLDWGILSCMRDAQKGRECVPLHNVNIGQWTVAFSCSQKIPAVAKKKGKHDCYSGNSLYCFRRISDI